VSRVKRIVGIVLAAVGGVLALAVALTAFLLFTGPGARLALSIANGHGFPAHARSIHGTLTGRFVLLGVEVHAGPVSATADTVEVAWRPLSLRSHHIDVTDVLVAGAHITLSAPGAPADMTGTRPAAKSGAPWTINAGRLRVRRTTLDAPGNTHLSELTVTASGSPDEYRATVRAAGSADRLSAVRAFVRAGGNTSAATADSIEVHALEGVVHGNAFVRWAPGLSWHARLAGEDLRADAVMKTSENLLGPVAFRARSTGLIHDDTTRVGVDLVSLESTLRGRPASARGRVDIDGRRISTPGLDVRWGRASASLSGNVEETASVRFDARIPSLAELLPGARGSASVRGTISGTRERIAVRVDARGSGVRTGQWQVPDATANIRATLSAQDYRPYAANVERALVDVAGGRLETSGRVSWRSGMEWNATVLASNIESSVFAPPRWNLRGPLSARATTSGTARGKNLRADLALASLSGSLRGLPVSGAGHIVVKDREADVSDLRLAWGDAHVRADGHAGKTLDLDLELAAPNLSTLVPSWRGAVSLRGKASGPQHRPEINATLGADSVRVHEYGATHIDGHVAFDAAFATPADVRITVLGARRGETVIDTVRVTATGPRDGHRVTLAATSGSMGGTITLVGAYADSSWSGRVDDLTFHEPTTGTWHAQHEAPLYVSRTHAALDSLVLASGDAHLSVQGTWRHGGRAAGSLALDGFPLALFQHTLRGATIDGAVNGSASFAMTPGAGLDAEADFTAGPGEIALGDQRLSYQGRVRGRAARDGVSTNVEAALNIGSRNVATAGGTISIPGFVAGVDSLAGHAVEGRIDLECGDIGPVLAVFAPGLMRASGALNAHVAPKGTTDNFRLVGGAALEKARFDTRDGLRLRDIDLKLVSDGEGKVTLDGGVTSGGGRVSIAASSARSEQGWVSGVFSAKGERFQLVNRPDAVLFISPDIALNVEERKALITGMVRVPYARIEAAQTPAAAVSPSPDVVMVEDTLAAKPKLEVRTQVRVALGDSVTFSGFGLRARLAGSLTVNDERGRPTQGTGEIQLVDGKYRAFGNELTIDQGRLVFGGGPIDNPGVDVRAVRGLTTQNVMASTGEMVGINVRGTLRKPVVSVFSNPPMSQNEIMSYLLTGHAPTSGDQSAMAGVAMLLAMQQGQQMAGDIGKKLSLETYLETGTEAGEASFVAGKYLSPKLYVSYAAGLFEHTNTFRTRYSLTGHWTLQAESGRYDSTDLLYWFERGK
jgi:translocation and assembly module TamB